VRARILTWNIHKGLHWAARTSELEPMREAIRAASADLVLLQEVRGSEAQLEYLADSLWPHHAYGRNAAYDGGHHGNAIMSRWPIEGVHNLDLTVWRIERRGALHATIRHPETRERLHAVSVHLDLFESNRAEQLERLIRYLSAAVPAHEALVLGGDFNDWRVRACRPLAARLGLVDAFRAAEGAPARTFPAHRPTVRLDRVYGRRWPPETVVSRPVLPAVALGDHLPLLVDARGSE